MGFDPEGSATGARLRAAGLDVRLAPKTAARTSADVRALLDGATAAIVSTDPFDSAVFAAAPALRVVARVGVGTDSIDLAAATRAGVVVTTTPGANRETTADHAVAMILSAIRRVVEHDASVRRGEWHRGGDLTPWDLHRTTVGLVGFGAIGRAVSRRLSGFDVDLLVCDPEVRAVPGAAVVDLDTLLRRSDVVSLHVPLTTATRGIIGREEIAALGPDAILVNTSRGGLVDEAALEDALRTRRLRAAALDVFADEPMPAGGLAALSNVVLTPHIGGLSVGSIRAMTAAATGHVLDVLRGRPCREAVANPEVLGSRVTA
jgi:phosphoglycerate dehydrogenase-like enzyme